MCARGRIDLPYRGSPLLPVHAVLGDVTIRSDGRIQPRAVATRDDVLRPMMIQIPARQLRDAYRRLLDLIRTLDVWKTHHGISVGDVQSVVHECHAERRIEARDKNAALIGHAV